MSVIVTIIQGMQIRHLTVFRNSRSRNTCRYLYVLQGQTPKLSRLNGTCFFLAMKAQTVTRLSCIFSSEIVSIILNEISFLNSTTNITQFHTATKTNYRNCNTKITSSLVLEFSSNLLRCPLHYDSTNNNSRYCGLNLYTRGITTISYTRP